MNSQKAAYWFALALFAFALHSEYQQGAFPALHRAVNRAGFTLCQLSADAERALAPVRVLEGWPTLKIDALLASEDARELALDRAEQVRDNAEMFRDRVRAQREMVRAQVRLQRIQVEQIRRSIREQVHITDAPNRRLVRIIPDDCAKRSVRIALDSALDSQDDDDGLF